MDVPKAAKTVLGLGGGASQRKGWGGFAKGGVWEMRATSSRTDRKTWASAEERVARIASTDGRTLGEEGVASQILTAMVRSAMDAMIYSATDIMIAYKCSRLQARRVLETEAKLDARFI